MRFHRTIFLLFDHFVPKWTDMCIISVSTYVLNAQNYSQTYMLFWITGNMCRYNMAAGESLHSSIHLTRAQQVHREGSVWLLCLWLLAKGQSSASRKVSWSRGQCRGNKRRSFLTHGGAIVVEGRHGFCTYGSRGQANIWASNVWRDPPLSSLFLFRSQAADGGACCHECDICSQAKLNEEMKEEIQTKLMRQNVCVHTVIC